RAVTHGRGPGRSGGRSPEKRHQLKRESPPVGGLVTIARLSAGLGLMIVLDAYLVDEAQLGLDPVDVLFLGGQDVFGQLAAAVVANAFEVGDKIGRASCRERR